ncbi:MAG: signal peptidase I [Legionellales bacterium]
MSMLILGHQYFGFGFNNTESLDKKVFFVHKNKIPQHGDFVVFYKNTDGILPDGTQFIKKIAGVSGDLIEHKNGTVSINYRELGEIKTTTQSGKLLHPGYVGIIPDKHYFVYTLHPRSFDSRYKEIGLIHENEIIGTATPLW